MQPASGQAKSAPVREWLLATETGLLTPALPASPATPSPMQVGPLCNGQICPTSGILPLTRDGQIPYVKRPEDSTEYTNMVRGGRLTQASCLHCIHATGTLRGQATDPHDHAL